MILVFNKSKIKIINKMNAFITGRVKSLKYAAKGAYLLITTEHSIIVQTCICTIVSFFGFYFDISKQDWINQIFAIGLVLSTEGVNTGIEKLADFVHLEQHPKIGFIKDVSAGAVTFSAISAIIIFIIIYSPYFTF